MSEREYRIDVCPECKVKEDDASEKKLYQCQYCERWFCERHIGLRVVHVPSYNEVIKDIAWREVVEKDRKRNDGHPDFAYTVEKLNELKIEKRLIWAEIGAALKKSRAYRKMPPEEPVATEYLGICPKCGSTRIMTTAFRKEFEAFQCLSCNHKWKEGKDADSEVRTASIVEEQREPCAVPTILEVEKPRKSHHISQRRRTLSKALRSTKNIAVLIISLAVLSVVILGWGNFFAQLLMPSTVNVDNVSSQLFKLINEERINRGLPALAFSDALTSIAKAWSENLAETDVLSHGNFASRISQIGYNNYQCGEIIAMYGGWAYSLEKEFVNMWLDSEEHREIMLTPISGFMGVGVSKGSGFFAVADFAFI